VGELELYALGGFDGSVSVDTVERFDPKTGHWETLLSPLPGRLSSFGVGVV
jgi:Kelch motif